MAKKDHTLGKLLALTTVAAAVGGVCYIFRDQIRESSIYRKSTNTLLGLLQKLPGQNNNQENNNFSLKSEEDDFSDCIFPDKKNVREYTPIHFNAKEEAEEVDTQDIHNETGVAADSSTTNVSDEAEAAADNTVANAFDEAEAATDNTVANASDEAEAAADNTVANAFGEAEAAADSSPVNTFEETGSSVQDTAFVDTAPEQTATDYTDNPIDSVETANADNPAPEEISSEETNDTAPEEIPPEETNGTLQSNSPEEASPAQESDSNPEPTGENMTEIFSDETIPIITFGGSFGIPTSTPEPATTPTWTSANSNEETVSAYENEGLSDVSEDPDVLEEQDRLDF
ncbi:MAG: hypothetical protein NC124_15060 [Clostridium sp.]|nr:hypothetical protein [Clostridium sp.]